MEVLICRINGKEAEDTAFSEFLSKLDDRKKAQILNYRFVEDKSRSLIAHLMVWCYLLKQEQLLNYSYNEQGRPFIACSEKQFSISHSGNYVVLAFDDDNVGVDIEKMVDIEPKILEIFCSNTELEYIKQKKYDKGLIYKLWTLKESYVKYLGEGVSDNIINIEFKIHEDSITCVEKPDLNFFSYYIGDYCMALCSKDKREFKIVNMTSEDIKIILKKE